MSLGKIFGESWREYWNNFSVFLKFMLIFLGLPTFILSIISTIYLFINLDVLAIIINPQVFSQLSLSNVFGKLAPYFVLILISGFISFLLSVYVLKGIVCGGLKKNKYNYPELKNLGKNGYWKFLGFCIVCGIFLFLLTLLLIIPGIIFGIFWIFGAYVFISQNKGIIDSLKTSLHMVRGRWWKTFGYLVLIILIGAGVSTVVSFLEIPFSVMSTVYATLNSSVSKPLFVASAFFSWLTNFLSNLFILPFSVIFFKNYYLEVLGKNKSKKDNKQV